MHRILRHDNSCDCTPELNTKVVARKWSQQIEVESELQVPKLERHAGEARLAIIYAEAPVLLAHRFKSESAIFDTPERGTSSEWQSDNPRGKDHLRGHGWQMMYVQLQSLPVGSQSPLVHSRSVHGCELRIYELVIRHFRFDTFSHG